jgi:phenylacetate-CoA ligase
LYDTLPVWVQNLGCTWGGLQRTRWRFGPHFRRTLAAWEKSGFASDAALREIQWRRLSRLLENARRFVPYYRELDLPGPFPADDAGSSLQQTLEALPVLEKQTYAAAPERFLAENISPRRLRKGKSSGTTGTALTLWYTYETEAENSATVWRMRRSFGVQLFDPHISFGGQTIVPFAQENPPYWRRNAWNRQTLFSLYHMKPENLDAYIDAIHSVPATYAQGYPSSMHLLARAMLDRGRPLPRGRLRAAFTSSESLLAFQRETIEKAFGAPVRDRYGTSECCVSMTACRENRLHVDMEFCIVEVEPVKETDEYVRGPLLVTGLSNDATPFIRYRVGDVGTRAKRPCPCGRPGDVFLDVDGRIEDYVVTPDGRRVGRLDHIFKEQLDVAEAQILQETPRSIEVLVVPRRSWRPESERSLREEIHTRLGDEIRVDLRLVGAIPREPNGKFRAVRSRVGRLPP